MPAKNPTFHKILKDRIQEIRTEIAAQKVAHRKLTLRRHPELTSAALIRIKALQKELRSTRQMLACYVKMQGLKSLAFVALLLLSACGRSGQDPAFASYLDSFQKEAETRGLKLDTSLSITFADDMDEGTGGQCHTGMGGTYIIINRPAWEQANETTREQTVFHELGHCVLGRPHLENGTTTLMTPRLPTQTWYSLFRTGYIDELFSTAGGVRPPQE